MIQTNMITLERLQQDTYNNAYYGTIKMKPSDVKSNTYVDSSEEI